MATMRSKRLVRRLTRKTVAKGLTPVERAYVRARELSRRTGKVVRFVVGIRPDGTERVTPLAKDSRRAPGRDRIESDRSELDRALARARQRGELHIAEILAGPEMLSADAFAERLGTTRATVTAWRHKKQVLGVEGATRGFRFPDWQIGNDGKPFAAFPELFDRLGGDAWAVYRFLVQRHPELGGATGREALQKGRFRQVIEAVDSAART